MEPWKKGLLLAGGVSVFALTLWLILRAKEEKIIGRQNGDTYYKRDGIWYHEKGHKVNQDKFYEYQYPY